MNIDATYVHIGGTRSFYPKAVFTVNFRYKESSQMDSSFYRMYLAVL